MVISGNDWDPYALSDEMKYVYDRLKDDSDSLCDLEDGEKYIKVYFGQIWIPDIWDQIEKHLERYDLWIETGEGDGADVYICGDYVSSMEDIEE